MCGDSGNDIDMFTIPGVKGCCVANSQDDLINFLKQKDTNDPELWKNNPVGAIVSQIKDLKPRVEVHFSNLPFAAAILDSINVFQFM